MKLSCYSLITILICITYISLIGSSYASADSSPMWYRYTIEQSNGTSGETYSHVVTKSNDGGLSFTTEWYPVSGKAVPWSNTVPANLSDNYTEYCAMSTAIREYFQNLDIIPHDIRFNQFVDVGHNYGSPTNTHIETDFFVVLGSTKYNSTMMNLGFDVVDSRYEQYSQSLLDCNSTSPIHTNSFAAENKTGTWQFDGNKWVFTEQNTMTVPEFPFAVPVMLIGTISTIVFYRMIFRK